MSESQIPQEKVQARSRFANVVNAREVPPEAWKPGGDRFSVRSRELALALPAKDLGYCIASVQPGHRSCPYHFHHAEEEVFYVLEGRGQLRQGDADGEEELIELGPGDCIAFPAGTGVAHQFVNPYDEPFTYFALSTRVVTDVCEYPDSNKVNIRSRRMILRRTPVLHYLDGEEG